MRPSGETNEAVQPPRETIAPMGWPVRSAKAAGSPSKPMAFSFWARSGICCGIHIPSSAARGSEATTRAAARKKSEGRVFMESPGQCPPEGGKPTKHIASPPSRLVPNALDRTDGSPDVAGP